MAKRADVLSIFGASVVMVSDIPFVVRWRLPRRASTVELLRIDE